MAREFVYVEGFGSYVVLVFLSFLKYGIIALSISRKTDTERG